MTAPLQHTKRAYYGGFASGLVAMWSEIAVYDHARIIDTKAADEALLAAMKASNVTIAMLAKGGAYPNDQRVIIEALLRAGAGIDMNEAVASR